MSFAIFDIVLYYLLEKKVQIRQFIKQITTIKKKEKANRFKKRLYNLILCNKYILIYIKTIYATKFRNCTIWNLNSKNKLQNLITIKATIFATRLKIVLKVF